MSKYTESEKYKEDRRKAVNKHNTEKMDAITIHVPKGLRQKYNDAAAAAGMSFRQYFMMAMEDRMEQDEAFRKMENLHRSDRK